MPLTKVLGRLKDLKRYIENAVEVDPEPHLTTNMRDRKGIQKQRAVAQDT